MSEKILNNISETVRKDFESVINLLSNKLNSNSSLSESISYSLSTRGKLKRALLMYLCYLCLNEIIEDTLRYASSSVELMHTASLIQDDIIDNGTVRRGKVSVYKKFGIPKAILTGDYLIFAALNLLAMAGANNHKVLEVTERMTYIYSEMCIGQSMEEELIGNIETGAKSYFKFIEAKTAAFFAGVCETGGILAGGSEEEYRAFYNLGYNLGIAYQIRDDLMDFIDQKSHNDKTINTDIERRLVTLPVIIAYEKGTLLQKSRLKNYYNKNYFLKPADIQEILSSAHAVDETISIIKSYLNMAIDSLAVIKESKWKSSLIAFANSLDIEYIGDFKYSGLTFKEQLV